MYDYAERIDPIWRYTEFIANHVGHKGVKCVHGTIDEEIEAIRVHLRELFDHFAVSEEEDILFRHILDFDDSVGTYNSHINRLANCVDRLGTYANISLELRKSFLT